jgi:flagellar biosynthesis chaperone FliJ
VGTATVTVSNKSEQAAALRAEAATLEKELSRLRADLEPAQRKLGELQDRQKQLERDSARGQQAKPDVISANLAQIAVAQNPVNGLTAAVTEKQSKLDMLRASLEALEREILAEKDEAQQRARVDAIIKQGREAEITPAAIALIELLTRREGIRQQLGAIINAGTLPNLRPAPGLPGELAAQARAALAEMDQELNDGAVLRAIRHFTRQGYEELGTPELKLHPLRPPRK